MLIMSQNLKQMKEVHKNKEHERCLLLDKNYYWVLMPIWTWLLSSAQLYGLCSLGKGQMQRERLGIS